MKNQARKEKKHDDYIRATCYIYIYIFVNAKQYNYLLGTQEVDLYAYSRPLYGTSTGFLATDERTMTSNMSGYFDLTRA